MAKELSVLQQQAEAIKTEVNKGANTSSRIGGMFGDMLEYNEEQSKIDEGNTGVSEYPEFSEQEEYKSGEVVGRNGKLYEFKVDHPAGIWNETHVEATSLKKIQDKKFTELDNNLYKIGSVYNFINGEYYAENGTPITYETWQRCEIDVKKYAGKSYEMLLFGIEGGIAYTLFVDEDNSIIETYQLDNIINNITGNIPQNASKLLVSNRYESGSPIINIKGLEPFYKSAPKKDLQAIARQAWLGSASTYSGGIIFINLLLIKYADSGNNFTQYTVNKSFDLTSNSEAGSSSVSYLIFRKETQTVELVYDVSDMVIGDIILLVYSFSANRIIGGELFNFVTNRELAKVARQSWISSTSTYNNGIIHVGILLIKYSDSGNRYNEYAINKSFDLTSNSEAGDSSVSYLIFRESTQTVELVYDLSNMVIGDILLLVYSFSENKVIGGELFGFVNSQSIEKPNTRNNLQGKKVIFIGDSITAAQVGVDENSVYHKIFANLYGCINVNLGVNSTCIANNTTNGLGSSRFVTRVTAENLEGASLIVIFGGTNDFSYDSKAIGDIFIEESIVASDRIGDKKIVPTDDTDTFDGAYHELIKEIRSVSPNTPILLITPMKRGRYQSGRPTSNEKNANGNYLDDFVSCIKKIGSYYSIPVLDLNSASQLDFTVQNISEKYSIDGLHPNADGHKLIGNLLFRFVENNIFVE